MWHRLTVDSSWNTTFCGYCKATIPYFLPTQPAVLSQTLILVSPPPPNFWMSQGPGPSCLPYLYPFTQSSFQYHGFKHNQMLMTSKAVSLALISSDSYIQMLPLQIHLNVKRYQTEFMFFLCRSVCLVKANGTILLLAVHRCFPHTLHQSISRINSKTAWLSSLLTCGYSTYRPMFPQNEKRKIGYRCCRNSIIHTKRQTESGNRKTARRCLEAPSMQPQKRIKSLREKGERS